MSNKENVTTNYNVLENGQIVSPPMEDMYPFLDRKEYEENIIKD